MANARILNAVFYVLLGVTAGRILPKDFTGMAMICRWFQHFRCECLFQTTNHHFVVADY
ncbi:hypothetical protein AAFN47_02105 [Hoeflea sp. CAU 1731]